MNTKKLLSFIMVLMLAINVSAESFTYFNRGIAFKCKVNDGKVTLTDFTLHFSCCFTNLLHSHFVPLLNNFTMQEKCY